MFPQAFLHPLVSSRSFTILTFRVKYSGMERTHLSFVAARFLLPVAGSRCLKGRILIELLSIDYIILDIIIIDWGKKKKNLERPFMA